MSIRKVKIWLTVFSVALFALGCSQSADNPKDAAAILTSSPKWKIDEIMVNDAITFKDGKMTQQFGGIDFERYMETIEIKTDGTFSGNFKGESKPFVLKWKENEKNITVGLGDGNAKSTDWTIDPKDVQKEAFVMKTQSTAYEYPNMTKIALKFKAAK